MKKKVIEFEVAMLGFEMHLGSHIMYNNDEEKPTDFKPISLIVDVNGKMYGGVSEEKVSWIKTNTRLYNLSDYERKTLLSLMYEYAMTELEDR